LKADLAPQGQDLLPESPDCRREPVGADVGLGLPEDLLRRPRRRQIGQHLPGPGIMGTGIELAVGKGPGAPLPELHVGFRVQHPGLVEALHVPLPLLHRAAPLQQDRHGAGPGQGQGGKEPRRARAAHHRPLFGRTGQFFRQPGRRFDIGRIFFLAPPEGYRRRDGEMHVVFVPGVHAAAQQPDLPELLFRQTQLFGAGGPEIPVQGEIDIPQLDHVMALLPAASPEAKAQWRL